ncbi:MAG TPA: kelch repeat-containing protein, partial [Candidatus Eremiobacteraceae bacterium]|nr:kelch repeat-containing protein [Candidatus Eremiobacteraceae bacterium]
RADYFFPAPGVVQGAWTLTGSLHTARVLPLAVALQSGKVLVTGGVSNHNQGLRSSELFDPQTGRWTSTGSMVVEASGGTMTLLTSGKVLVAGGLPHLGAARASQLYDPATGRWSLTGRLNSPRLFHTATLLNDGRVLVTGGQDQAQTGGMRTAEIYNPATGTWKNAASMTTPRQNHTAALLHDGRVLVTGGNFDIFFGELGSSEIYDPASGHWATVGRMTTSRVSQTETVLADGSVIVAGGGYGTGVGPNPLATTDRFDPASGVWFPSGDMHIAKIIRPAVDGRIFHTATVQPDGRVLAAGGSGFTTDFNHIVVLKTAELYDPTSGTWALTGNMHVGRALHAAVQLLDGRTLVISGEGKLGPPTATAEIFSESVFDSNSAAGPGDILRTNAASRAQLLRRPPSMGIARRNLHPSINASQGKWTLTGSMNVARSWIPMTLLKNGKVLIEGGDQFASGGVTAEIFDPATGKWTLTGSMHFPRFQHSAMLLADGRVLVVGGTSGVDWWASAEIYNPNTGRWTMAKDMNSTRTNTAILRLADGRLLVPGGAAYVTVPRDSADIYDQTKGTWLATTSLNISREEFISAVLQNGKALVADGLEQNNTFTTTSELYDPATNVWSFTGSTKDVALNGVLLSSGKMLATDEPGAQTSELYDPATGRWSATAGSQQLFGRSGDTVTLLTSGLPLLAGGCTINDGCPTTATEVFDPATQLWALDASLNVARYVHAAVKLQDGRVLVAGGLNSGFVQLSSAEIYTPAHLARTSTWRSR